LKVLIKSLRNLQEKYHYVGEGVRVLNVRADPRLSKAFDNYKVDFARDKQMNHCSVSSWSRDIRNVLHLIERGRYRATTVLYCKNIHGYSIKNISLNKIMGNKDEKEILVEGPSFFKVVNDPIKIDDLLVFVHMDFDYKTYMSKTYLKFTQSWIKKETEILNRTETISRVQKEEIQADNDKLIKRRTEKIKQEDRLHEIIDYLRKVKLGSKMEFNTPVGPTNLSVESIYHPLGQSNLPVESSNPPVEPSNSPTLPNNPPSVIPSNPSVKTSNAHFTQTYIGETYHVQSILDK